MTLLPCAARRHRNRRRPRANITTNRRQSRGTTTGEWSDGLAEGAAVALLPNDERHFGLMREGERSGYGVYQYSNGDVYQGQFRGGQPHGRGVWRQRVPAPEPEPTPPIEGKQPDSAADDEAGSGAGGGGGGSGGGSLASSVLSRVSSISRPKTPPTTIER